MNKKDATAPSLNNDKGGPLPFTSWPTSPRFKLGSLGAEAPLSEVAAEFHRSLHTFAERTMRPVGKKLDRMSALEVIADGSPLWDFWRDYRKLGIDMDALAMFDPEDTPVIFNLLFEELGWGDSGLAISAAAGILPHYMAVKYGNDFVSRTYPEPRIGCWGITEPDHGSDSLDPNGAIFHATGKYGRPNCTAKITDGKVIINGQKSAWVSNGPIADLCILYCAAQTAGGEVETARGAVVIVPLDAPGVSRGKPLEKMGQRALPQGEIFFDNVELDIDHLLVAPEDYLKGVYAIHSEANALMGATFTGCARSAYEHAYLYAHERKQGGVPIIRHQDVAKRLFHMARKVELARAMSRRAVTFNMSNEIPSLPVAMFAKITGTKNAFEVANEALQMFGGNGMTLEYPVEKILRDARASLIEDGCNEILAIKGGMGLIDPELLLPTA